MRMALASVLAPLWVLPMTGCTKSRFRGWGFSLLELVLVLVITGLVAMVASRFLLSALEAVSVSREYEDQRSEAGFALDRMAREVRGGDVTACESGQLEVQRGGQTFLFEPDDGGLLLEVDGDRGVLIEGLASPDGLTCEEAPWGISDLYALQLNMDSGYEASTHAWQRP
ncbi:hypothetical protein [Thioalkalivibrio sp. ALgr3]|uniref:hypothetical protein n=1 Tax=Thioalkalivibrio sp. ALgr3 TaxID=1239292 RepID=UPI00037FB913|nr:hypothetical protein [Thioalkalivibrio sp. ALgr3]